MRTLLALAFAAALATPAFADTAPPPGGPGEVLIPGSAPGVVPRMIPTVMPPHVPEIAYQNMVRSVAMFGLNQRDFAFLNAKAAGYRAAQSRSAMGEWELDYLYYGMAPSFSHDAARNEQVFAATSAEMQDWIKQTPAEPTPHLAYAWLLIQHAWAITALATENADDSPDGLKRMAAQVKLANAEIAKARAYLEAHRDLAARDPQWYVLMLDVARSQDPDAPGIWPIFDEGTQRYPNYAPIYYAYIEYALRTKHKDPQRIAVAVGVALQRSRATEGNQMYARLWGYLSTCGCDHGNLFRTTQARWPDMRESWEEIARQYPDPWVYDSTFYYACQAGDRAEAVLALDKIVNLVTPSPVWHGQMDDRGSCQLWATGHQNHTPFEPIRPLPPNRAPAPIPAMLQGVFARILVAFLSLFA